MRKYYDFLKTVKNHFRLAEAFLLLHVFAAITVTIITFFGITTQNPTNSTVPAGRTKDGQKGRDRETEGYKETARRYIFA